GGALLTTVPTPRWETDGPFPALRRLGLDAFSDAMNAVLRRLWRHVTVEDERAWRVRLACAGMMLAVWETYMGPTADARYAGYLHLTASPDGEAFPSVRCTGCRLVYVNPRRRQETLAAIYRSGYFRTRDHSLSGYRDYLADRDILRVFFNRQLDTIELHAPAR